MMRVRWGVLAALLVVAACDSGGSGEGEQTSNNSNSGQNSPTPDGPCESDFDCVGGQYCVEQLCRSPGEECQRDSDCEALEVCVVGYCAPFEGECAQDADCGEGKVCDEALKCRAGCREDADCGEGRACDLERLVCYTPRPECPESCPAHQACDPDTGECAPDGTCDGAEDCPGEQVCVDGLCADPPEVCTSGEDCEEGEYCDRDSGQCKPGCRQANECDADEVCVDGVCTVELPECLPDPNEPNDAQEQAKFLTVAEPQSGLTLCDESDWFQFFGFNGDRVRVNITFSHDAGDLNARLYDPEGELLQQSSSRDDDELLQRTLTASGVYRFEVYGGGRGVYTEYGASLEITRTCEADALEENDTAQEATVLEGLEVEEAELSVCGADDDWFTASLYPGETLRASVRFVHAVGDVNLELYDEASQEIAASRTQGDEEVVTHTAAAREDVWLRVPGAEGLINLYDLGVEITPADCEDAAEAQPDGTAQTAREVAITQSPQGQICAGDADWYAVLLPSDLPFTATLTHSAQTGDLNLALLGPDGRAVLDEGATDQDIEQVEVTTDAPGLYYLRVTGEGRAQGAYSLSMEGGPQSDCPRDDGLEPNDAFDAPSALESGTYGDLILCGVSDREDWYSFALTEGQSVEVFALASARSGEVEVALYAPDAQGEDAPTEQRTGAGEVKRVRAQAGAPAGQWRVRVRTLGEADVPYSLRLFVYDGRLPLDCEFDDDFEPNDAARDAGRLPLRREVEGVICRASDWYRFDAQAGELVVVSADFEHAQGNVDLSLYAGRDLNAPVAVADGELDGERAQFLAEQSGPVFVKVSLTGREEDEELGNVYRLVAGRVQGGAAADCEFDDDFEPNDFAQDAAPLAQGRVQAALCGDDDDFYALDVEPGQVVRAWALSGERDALSLVLEAEGVEPVMAAAEGDFGLGLAHELPEGARAWRLRVRGDGEVEAPYALALEVLDAAPQGCEPSDSLEPNDRPGQAAVVSAEGTTEGLTLCGGDEDWFWVELPEGQGLKVEALYDPAGGNVQLELFDPLGLALSASYGDTGRDAAIAALDEGVPVLVRAFAEDGEAASYALAVDFDEELGNVCRPDGFEPNDEDDDAARVNVGRYQGLTACADSEDWYVLSASFFDTVSFRVDFDGQEADLNLTLYDPFLGQILDRSTGFGDSESVETVVFNDGDVLVRVYVSFGRGAEYEMQVSRQ